MDEEIKAILKNGTWEVATLLEGQMTVGLKWVYITKKNAKGEVERHKAGLVIIWYNQRPDIDYDEAFAPIAHVKK